jgi:DNA polymerase (family 10)
MTNIEISRLFKNVAAAYTILDEKKYRFQIIAYQKASESIEGSHHELQALYKEGKIDEIAGIGASMKGHLKELFEKGKVEHFVSILKNVPQAVFPLLDVPSFGPKKAFRLVSEFNLKNPDSVIQDLIKIAKEGKIAPLAGFGEKSQKDILQAFEEYGRGKTKTARMVLPYATELARKMLVYLKESNDVVQAEPLGSLRRRRSTTGDIDIAVSTNNPDAVLEHFTNYPHKERIIERGERTSSILVSGGRQIDLMVEKPKAFGALLQHFTGSKAHNVKLREYALTIGLSLSDYGMRKKGTDDPYTLFDSEEKFYKKLGMQWVPPEIRENKGEIELALQNKLPKLVELADIKGDFHLHSSFPVEESHDAGQSSMEEMLEKALSLGYKYVGFSEHNPSQSGHTPQEVYKLLEKRQKHIEELRSKYKNSIRIFSLLETDILPNGKLAIDDDALSLLDATIVSVHSSFSMDREAMTERVLKGLTHPKAKILAHPTGRLLNQRPGYEIDWNKLFDFAVEHHKALEINSWPLRLDLPDELVFEAKKKGVRFFIDTDSHEKEQMDMMEFGVSVAKRGWATTDDIMNTKEYNEIDEFFKRGR